VHTERKEAGQRKGHVNDCTALDETNKLDFMNVLETFFFIFPVLPATAGSAALDKSLCSVFISQLRKSNGSVFNPILNFFSERRDISCNNS
jgi:hypothetical protein